jgi:hypothetical protein
MLVFAAACCAIWNVWSLIAFEKKVVRFPMVTIFSMCLFLRYWAGLYGADDEMFIKGGAEQLMYKASELMGFQEMMTGDGAAHMATVVPGRLMITEG